MAAGVWLVDTIAPLDPLYLIINSTSMSCLHTVLWLFSHHSPFRVTWKMTWKTTL
jgi:hypothetical protein